ncbi:AAA family ATPase [Morganella morganii]|nr:AAA family ATPase [Morganella morganii]EKU5692212.1 AAA family ATPase [Morganella morganii]
MNAVNNSFDIKRNTPVDMESLGIILPENLKGKYSIKGFSNDHQFSEYIPKFNEKYVFEPSLRKHVLMWFDNPLDTSLWISGPTGCGKSSIVEQIAARMNWGLMKVTASPDLDMSSLLGSFRLKVDKLTGDQETVFHEGPLTIAYKHGLVFLIDEYDQLEPSVANALNGILEMGSLVIPETNECIHHHENFRFAVTANSNGTGDMTGNYSGVKPQNIANLDRFMFVEADYMPEKEERKLLASFLSDPESHQLLTDGLIKLANDVRKSTSATVTNFSSTAISTRSLVNVVRRFDFMLRSKQPPVDILLDAWQLHISNRAPEDEKIALNDMFNVYFKS